MNSFSKRLRRAFRARRGSCENGAHYYVKQGGQWVCTMCGATR